MKKIAEVIVVEGQNDVNKLLSCVNADVIKTNGTHLSKSFLAHLKQLSETREIIVMTDDDYPGRWIRTQIQEAIGQCKHAFISKEQSSTSRKVGIEHASCETIQKALTSVISFDKSVETISLETFMGLGFQGRSDSSTKREHILKQLRLPAMNAKRFYKTLNMMRIPEEELIRMMEEGKP